MGHQSPEDCQPKVVPICKLLDRVDHAQWCSVQSPWYPSYPSRVQRGRQCKSGNNNFIHNRTIDSSNTQYCFRDEVQSFVGDTDSVDLDECGTEKVVRVWLVYPSFHSNLSSALRKLQDAKLVIDQFGFQLDGTGIQRENETVEEQARLSNKLTVLVNDIGIAMKRMGYALYGGKVYKKRDKAKYTCSYKCEVEAFVNSLAANELFKARLLKDMKKSWPTHTARLFDPSA